MNKIIFKNIFYLSIFLCLKQDITQAMEITNKEQKVLNATEINKNKYTLCIICRTLHTNIERHTRVHTGEKPYQCIYCNKRFSDRGNCTRHKKAHEKINIEQPLKKQPLDNKFGCDMCPKTFIWKHNLTKHKKESHPIISPQFYIELESWFGTNNMLNPLNNEII